MHDGTATRISLLRPRLCLVALTGLFWVLGGPSQAEEFKLGSSPLDTLLSTKLWADVPEAKDFVRATRPPPDSLAYQPVTGTDPERPKLRTKEELTALQSELERSAESNAKKAGRHPAVDRRTPARPAAAKDHAMSSARR